MDAPSVFPPHIESRVGQAMAEDSVSLSRLLEDLIGFLRRQWPIFAFLLTCSALVGFVYFLTAPPRYTANSKMLIDSSKLRVVQQQQSPVTEVPLDTSQVESQVELLKSDNIGLGVIKALHLSDDPEFIGGKEETIEKTPSAGSASAVASERLIQRALRYFLRNRNIYRVGRTYVLEIEFSSLRASQAAAVANAIADAYIADQLDAKFEATRRGGAWLQDRINELRTQAIAADRAVLDYKEKNKIVDVNGGSGGSGMRLMGEQQLTDLNAQLGAARAATAEAQAKLDRIDEIMKHDVADAGVSDAIKNDLISKLRSEYYELSGRESQYSARYGAQHLAVVNLRTQMDSIRRSILEELRRIQQSYKSDYEISKTRVDSLEKSLAVLVSGSQSVNRGRLGLSELESTAHAYHSVYDNFLQRYMETVQQESFPISEARVISRASVPTEKSSPHALKVFGIAGVIGLVFSFGIGFIREAVDRVFRTTRQVEGVLNTHCLAVLPLLTEPQPPKQAVSETQTAGGSDQVRTSLQKVLEIVGAPNIPPPRATKGSFSLDRWRDASIPALLTKEKMMRYVVDEPLSAFAEAFRSIKVTADISGSIRNHKVIGVTSTLPKEGKSTVSSNLAQSIAHAGKNVILIDGDLRNPTLTRSLAPHVKAGLREVLAGKASLQEVTCLDSATNLAFLPAVMSLRSPYTNEILASDAFRQLIDNLRKTYDYIIIDFPPVAPVVDVRAALQVVDSFIYVVEWGKTSMVVVERQMAAVPELQERLLGVVLNKTNVKLFERYEGLYAGYYHKPYYGRYGYTS